MTLRTDLADDTASLTVHAAQHNEVNAAVLALPTGGMPVVRKFPFAYNSSGIATGFTVYTPTIGDVLLDAWIEIVTAWNGTTPLGDFGTFLVAAPNNHGMFWQANAAIEMTAADAVLSNQTGFRTQAGSFTAISDLATNNGPSLGAFRMVPGKFTTADPLKVVVTQNGTPTGTATGASQGSAILYLITATPV